MADRVRTAAARLAERLLLRAATQVSYVQGATTHVGLPAIFGRTEFAITTEAGNSVIEYSDADFIMSPDDVTWEPVRGHRITYDGVTYEVTAPVGAPCWRWTDNFQVLRRIHTKVIDRG